MNQTEFNQTQEDDVVGRTLRDAGSIGRTWARYGLLAGKTALETSAVTLEKVAGMLDNIASAFKEGETVEAKGETVEETKSDEQGVKSDIDRDEVAPVDNAD